MKGARVALRTLRIFETDPEAAPKPRQRFSDDVVGRFRSGYQLNNRPAALTEWRVTTGDPEVADAIRALLGGEEPQPWDAKGEDNLETFTKAKSVEILLDGPRSVRSSMVLWGRNGKAIRRCDGVDQIGDGKGKGCECPASFAERKEAAKAGTGCDPQIEVYFRLAADPDLGIFKFQTGSWSMVRDLGAEEDKLAEIDGPARATLELEEVSFVAKNGPRKGQTVSFTKPVLTILGPAE
jgi:hypothetical protein